VSRTDLVASFKEQAAFSALEYLHSGMRLGLGSGSTTNIFTDLLGERIRSGALKDIMVVPTSEATAARARSLGIPLASLSQLTVTHGSTPLDMVIDGADEVDGKLNLIKGLGRALLREKIVAIHAARFIVIVDESKLVARLGEKGPLPVEILPFEAEAHVRWLRTLDCRSELWREADGSPVVTDNGNYLVLCRFEGGIPDVTALSRRLQERPGIIESGLFIGMASSVLVAGSQGVRILEI
jgi:ribose 5-phosphate isomerase A